MIDFVYHTSIISAQIHRYKYKEIPNTILSTYLSRVFNVPRLWFFFKVSNLVRVHVSNTCISYYIIICRKPRPVLHSLTQHYSCSFLLNDTNILSTKDEVREQYQGFDCINTDQKMRQILNYYFQYCPKMKKKKL